MLLRVVLRARHPQQRGRPVSSRILPAEIDGHQAGEDEGHGHRADEDAVAVEKSEEKGELARRFFFLPFGVCHQASSFRRKNEVEGGVGILDLAKAKG